MSVSGISFRAGSCTDSARDVLNQPQKHTSSPQSAAQAPEAAPVKKKSNKFLKAVAGVVVTAAVIAGGLAAGKYFGGFDKLIKYAGEDAKGFKAGLKTVANWGNTAGNALIGWGRTACDAVTGLFKKGGEKAAEA